MAALAKFYLAAAEIYRDEILSSRYTGGANALQKAKFNAARAENFKISVLPLTHIHFVFALCDVDRRHNVARDVHRGSPHIQYRVDT